MIFQSGHSYASHTFINCAFSAHQSVNMHSITMLLKAATSGWLHLWKQALWNSTDALIIKCSSHFHLSVTESEMRGYLLRENTNSSNLHLRWTIFYNKCV